MHEDGCDNCGNVRELYHFDAVVEGNPDDGAALCDDCNTEANAWDAAHGENEVEVGPFHAELHVLIDSLRDYAEGADRFEADGEDEAQRIAGYGEIAQALIPQAEMLLALPEEVVAKLVTAAQSMTEAASFGR
jgi:hypothetical protein